MEETIDYNNQTEETDTPSYHSHFNPLPDELEHIQYLAKLGCNENYIAAHFDTTREHLMDSCGHVVSKAAHESRLSILQVLYDLAGSGRHPSVTMFWAKVFCASMFPASGEADGESSKAKPKPPAVQKPKFDRVVFHVYNNEGEPNLEV